MKNALELKSFLESKKLDVFLNLECDEYHPLSSSPYLIFSYEKIFEIIKGLGLKKVTINGYSSSEDRSDLDLSVSVYLNGPDPKEEYKIHTSNFPNIDSVLYHIIFQEKHNNLKEFLENNEFINKKYGELEKIFKNCFNLKEKDILNEIKTPEDRKHQFRFRSYSDDVINSIDYIGVSGNKDGGYAFSVRYGITKNPDAVYKAINDSKAIINDFFKQK